jgi:hypothetical protein
MQVLCFVLIALVVMVHFSSSLDHFRSSGNNIGDAGVTSLSEALERNTTLTSLDLSGECVASFFVFFVVAHMFSEDFEQDCRDFNYFDLK